MRREEAAVVVGLMEKLAEEVGLAGASRALAIPRSWYYRQKGQPSAEEKQPVYQPQPAHALSETEKNEVRQVLHSERFVHQTPREVYATLLDEGVYYCSWRTMYRILAEQGGRQEQPRRRQRLTYTKPQLVARGPNQVWSWDITFLSGPKRGCFYYLYVIMDIFSRYVVGWLVAEAESAEWARQLIEATCAKQKIQSDQLTLHADRGGAMKALSVADLLERLSVTKSHSRPHTADDNPYSESQFKTLKQHPTFPKQFAGIQAARSWASAFFDWYNHDHHHVALGLMTPAVVHDGQADAVRSQRQQVLNQAYARHPDRFPAGPPLVAALPKEVWINQPPASIETAETLPALPLVVAPTQRPA